MGAVHARIPMVTADEQRALQLENAKADERLWEWLRGANAATAAQHKALAVKATQAATDGEAQAANAGVHVQAAQDRIAHIERGEDVSGGLGKPIDISAMLLASGFTKADLRRMRFVGSLSEEIFKTALRSLNAGDVLDRAFMRRARTILKQQR